MKIYLDDTTYHVDNADENIFKCNCHQQFDGLIQLILTEAQLYQFIGRDTARTFIVSDKKIKDGKNYMENNIWNDKI